MKRTKSVKNIFINRWKKLWDLER